MSLSDAIINARPATENRISALPVVEPDGRIVGIVSEGDLMRRTESKTERQPSWWLSLLLLPKRRAIDYVKAHGRRTGDVMTREVITVNDDASLEEIAELLERHRIKRVPVIRGGRLVGIVSRAYLLHGLVAGRTAGGPSADDRELKTAVEKTLSDVACELSFSTSSSPAGWFTSGASSRRPRKRRRSEPQPRARQE